MDNTITTLVDTAPHPGCNLIINYIPPSLNEDGLRSLFRQYGEILNCKLMIDKHSGHSLGYGFVEFKDPEGAASAIDDLNGKQIENKRLKVSYARPPSNDIQHANLYVARLDQHVTKQTLDKIFSPYGAIIDSKILVDPKTGESRGVGFVRYDTQSQAQAAINALNGQLVPGNSQSIQVKFADSMDEKIKKKRKMAQQPRFGGFSGMMGGRYSPYAISGAAAGSVGMYETAHYNPGIYDVMNQPASNNFSYPGSVHNPQLQQHTQQPTQQQQAQHQQSQHYCVFAYNLPATADESLLYRLFSPFGAIVSVKIIRDLATGTCKGYGFVNYLKLEEAQQSILNLNGMPMGNKMLQVSFKTPGKKATPM